MPEDIAGYRKGCSIKTSSERIPLLNIDASEEKNEEKKKSLSLPTSSSKETGNSRDQR